MGQIRVGTPPLLPCTSSIYVYAASGATVPFTKVWQRSAHHPAETDTRRPSNDANGADCDGPTARPERRLYDQLEDGRRSGRGAAAVRR
jgi:hypothetical protein